MQTHPGLLHTRLLHFRALDQPDLCALRTRTEGEKRGPS